MSDEQITEQVNENSLAGEKAGEKKESKQQGDQEPEVSSDKRVSKKILVLGVLLALALVAAGGVYRFYFFPSNESDAVDQQQHQEVASDQEQKNIYDSEKIKDQKSDMEFNQQDVFADDDGDGLTNYEEKIVFATNPNEPDTDKDGFKDGDEVTNGYSPSGGGKIDLGGENGICQREFQYIVDHHGESYADCYGKISEAQCNGKTKKVNLAVIVDASWSMAGKIGDKTKMKIAKESTAKFIENIKTEVNLSLIVFGHKGSNQPKDKGVSCQGIENVEGRDQIAQKMGSLNAVGFTPLASSLGKARDILSKNNPLSNENIILLISDGKDSCDGDPQKIAQGIKRTGTMVHVVGFDAQGSVEDQLKDVASGGGGLYYSARNFDELVMSLANVTKTTCVQKENSWPEGLAPILDNSSECLDRINGESLNVGLAPNSKACEKYIELKYSEREKSIRAQIEAAFAGGIEKSDKLSPAASSGSEPDDITGLKNLPNP